MCCRRRENRKKIRKVGKRKENIPIINLKIKRSNGLK